MHGGIKIDIDALVRIADLFRHRMDPAVLAVLAERPYRFRALSNRLTAQVRVHVDDNAVSRSLKRLTRHGLVRADSKRHGTREINLYMLTDTGREMYLTYEAIHNGYADVHMLESQCDGNCDGDGDPCDEHAA
jgi:DNA-binding HxlR family transcriptional regulator